MEHLMLYFNFFPSRACEREPQQPIKVKPLYFIVMMTTLPESIDHLRLLPNIHSYECVINQLVEEMKRGEQMEINIFIIIILQYSLLLCASLSIKATLKFISFFKRWAAYGH